MRLLRLTEPIADFHARPVPADLAEAEAWLFDPGRPALVLGSSQDPSQADHRAAAAAGAEVVRRRSGGGAVWVPTSGCLWIDVVVPRHDARWSDDVRESVYWLGEAWTGALRDVGLDAELYRGGLEKTDWGTYAKSVKAPDGSKVTFRATGTSGATATSAPTTWT